MTRTVQSPVPIIATNGLAFFFFMFRFSSVFSPFTQSENSIMHGIKFFR